MKERKELQNAEKNKVKISGELCDGFSISHEVFGEKFYKNRVKIVRHSGTEDYIPILVSNYLFSDNNIEGQFAGKWVEIEGELRSYNKKDKNKTHLYLNVFAKEMEIYDTQEEIEDVTKLNENFIFLDGYICKKAKTRITPSSNVFITDLLIAVNRKYGKSDYIPSIVWGREAIWAGKLDVGTRVQLEGRFQSREYTKYVNNEEYTKVAYELSVKSIQEFEED